ncbi:MAG: MFS transporter [Acidimicrobiales bacterium]
MPDAPVGDARPTTDEDRGAFSLFSWRAPTVLAVAAVAVAAGFGQFGAVAALGNVAKTFGHVTHGGSLAARVGLSGSTIGIGLALIRVASIGGLPLAGLADRLGRRRTLLACCAAGLVITAGAALSPNYWWFVAIFALGRPMLSATNALAQVSAGELTSSANRAKAVSLVAAGYAVGAGVTAILYNLGRNTIGFRGVFALAVVPLLALPFIARTVAEPDRFQRASPAEHGEPVLGPVGRRFRRRLLLVCAVGFAVSVITGPANSFVFVYAQDVRHVSGTLTAAMVVIAAPAGLAGLLAGRWMADHLGRRPTIVTAMVGMAGFGILLYSGTKPALFAGYALGALAGGIISPPLGSMVNEVFPTSVRASVAGWFIVAGVIGAVVGLILFGAVADVGNRLNLAAIVTFLPVLPISALLFAIPESKGKEPEDLSTAS